MTGDVNGQEWAVEDLGVPLHKVINGARDASLVARDRVRGDDHDVPPADLDGAVGAAGDAREGRQRLALGAGGEDGDVAVGDPVYIPLVHEHRLGQIEVAQVARDVDVADHGAAREANEPVVVLRRLDYLGDPVYMRGEGCDYDPAFRPLEDLVEGFPYQAFGGHVSGPFAVGGIPEVCEHAL